MSLEEGFGWHRFAMRVTFFGDLPFVQDNLKNSHCGYYCNFDFAGRSGGIARENEEDEIEFKHLIL